MRRALSGLTLVIAVLLASIPSALASTSLTTQTSDIRASVVNLSRDYERQFGPRVLSSERQELREMTREARREMNTLHRLVQKAERTDARTDWTKARSHYDAIRISGDTRLNEARDILTPHMSFSEQIQAWSTAQGVLQELDSLGAELDRRAG